MHDDKDRGRRNEFLEWRRWILKLMKRYLSTNRYPHHRLTLRLLRHHPYTRPPPRGSPSIPEHFVYFQGRPDYDFPRWEASTRHRPRGHGRLRLSYHPRLPLTLVLQYPDVRWDYRFLLLYRRWTMDAMERLDKHRRVDWRLYSRNPFLTMEQVDRFLDRPWDWNVLAMHPNFPPHRIVHSPRVHRRWAWSHVFKNPMLHIDTWHRLSKESTRHLILYNHFQCTPSVRLWANLRILHFCCRVRDRRRLLEKLRLLLYIHRRCGCDDLVHRTMSFLVSSCA